MIILILLPCDATRFDRVWFYVVLGGSLGFILQLAKRTVVFLVDFTD